MTTTGRLLARFPVTQMHERVFYAAGSTDLVVIDDDGVQWLVPLTPQSWPDRRRPAVLVATRPMRASEAVTQALTAGVPGRLAWRVVDRIAPDTQPTGDDITDLFGADADADLQARWERDPRAYLEWSAANDEEVEAADSVSLRRL